MSEPLPAPRPKKAPAALAALVAAWLLAAGLALPPAALAAPKAGTGTGKAPAAGELLLHARMESEAEIGSPARAAERVAGWEQGKGVRKSAGAEVRFEPGRSGQATRFVTSGATSAVAVFAPGNFDFADLENRGGRLEFWLKFNEDPHQFKGNRTILRTEPYPPVLTVEIYGTRPFLALEFHGNGNNPKTNYRFLTYTEGWDAWYRWQPGEWHKVTLSWKRNLGEDAAELHLYLDDSQAGCPAAKCNDYSGRLPEPGSWNEILVGNFGRKFGIDFSIADLTSFGSAGPDREPASKGRLP